MVTNNLKKFYELGLCCYCINMSGSPSYYDAFCNKYEKYCYRCRKSYLNCNGFMNASLEKGKNNIKENKLLKIIIALFKSFSKNDFAPLKEVLDEFKKEKSKKD